MCGLGVQPPAQGFPFPKPAPVVDIPCDAPTPCHVLKFADSKIWSRIFHVIVTRCSHPFDCCVVEYMPFDVWVRGATSREGAKWNMHDQSPRHDPICPVFADPISGPSSKLEPALGTPKANCSATTTPGRIWRNIFGDSSTTSSRHGRRRHGRRCSSRCRA